MSKVVGIDGARGAWVAIVLEAGAFAGCMLADTLADIVARHPGAGAFGIDVPIGFPTVATDGVRAADVAARAFVGPRRSSVFPMPARDVLEAGSYAEANALSRERYGRGISRQAYALRENILEADRLSVDPRVFEVHPEVSFRALKGDVLEHAKKSWNGLQERIRLLEDVGIRLPTALPCGKVAADDVVDAAAAAWSAERVARGGAGMLPEGVGGGDADEGTPRIWY